MGNNPLFLDKERTMTALCEQAEQYRFMTASKLFGFWVADSSGKIMEVNDTYCRMSGYSREELLQLSISDVEAVESAEEIARHIDLLVSTGTDQFESRQRAKDGRIFDVEISTTYLPSQGRIIVLLRDISDRKRIEKALLESEVRYHAIIEDQTELICRYLSDGRISFVNEAYARYFGKLPTEIVNQNFIPHIPEPDLSTINDQLERISPDNPVVEIEYRVIMPDGETRWHNWTHRGIFSGGDIVEYQAVGRDISERKRAEVEVEERNRFMDTLLEAIPVPVFFKDRSARYLGFNRAYEDFFGKSREELIGKSVFDIAPRELAETYHAKDDELFRNAGSQIYESRVMDARGVERSVLFHKAAYLDQDGAVNGLIGAITDITERKAWEKALQESRGRLKAYMDNSIDVIFSLNAKGSFLFVSRAWERHFGTAIKDVLRRDFSSFVHPDDVSSCSEYLAYILCGKKSKASSPYRVKRSDGSWRWFVTNGSRYRDPEGNWQFIGVAHDNTDQYETEEQLRQAKAAAESANLAKSVFLATMSHEIRTPLSALLGNIDLLSSSQLTPEQQVYLRDCRTASRMLQQVINDVLDFSKIEAGKLELVNLVFSVSSMARQLVRIFAASAEQKGLKLTLSLADNLPPYISSDQYRLRQIISNLLSNAVKFTDHGTVSLKIAVGDRTSSAPDPDMVELLVSVHDTGTGIPQDKQALIFDSFTQVEEFSTRRHAGTGLGLAICRRLAGMMGGTISLSSVPGEGTVFVVSLPVAVYQAPQQQVMVKREKTPAVTPRTVLLADDDELGRTVTAALLQRRGHRVTVAANGSGLLDELQRQKFDIVLSDISMPDMDGMEVARIIRSGVRAGIDSMIPIIALTAHAFEQDQARFLESGINGYASKPVNFEELLSQIEELCDKTSEQSANPHEKYLPSP